LRICYDKENKTKNATTILTPRANVDNAELRSVRSSADWLSEYRFEQNTKYKDIVVIKTAWIVDIALHRK
jgi:hypothetical protein